MHKKKYKHTCEVLVSEDFCLFLPKLQCLANQWRVVNWSSVGLGRRKIRCSCDLSTVCQCVCVCESSLISLNKSCRPWEQRGPTSLPLPVPKPTKKIHKGRQQMCMGINKWPIGLISQPPHPKALVNRKGMFTRIMKRTGRPALWAPCSWHTAAQECKKACPE